MKKIDEKYPHVERIESFIERNNYSQNRLANEMDIGGGQLSQYRRRIYHERGGNVESINRKIDAYFRAREREAEYFEEQILQLKITAEIQKFVDVAQASKECGLLFGGAGLGKTVAIKQYQEKEPYATLVTATNSYSSVKGIISLLYENFSGSYLTKNAAYGYGYLQEVLPAQRQSRIVIIDQAHRLNNKAFQEVQALYDATGVPFVFVGTRLVYDRLKDEKKNMILAEMASRITIIKEFEIEPYQEDLQKYCAMYGVSDAKMIKLMAEKARFGGLRIVRGILRKAKKISDTGDIDITDLLFSAEMSELQTEVRP